jgi:choice-of-anchor B domain-containing protein
MKFYCFVLPFVLLGWSGSYRAQNDALNVGVLDNWYDGSVFYNGMDFQFNEVWAFEQDQRQYAVIGSTMGIHLFELINDSIHFLWEEQYSTQIIHRDYHDYNGYLYAGCAENYGLYRYDMSYLPDSLYRDTVYDFTHIHNLFIDTSTAMLYMNSDANGASISLPIDSNGHVSSTPTYFLPYYAHDFYARNDTLIANCGLDGLLAIDYNAANPQYSQLQFYTDKGYNHSGWLDESGTIYAFIDETEGTRIKVCDVSDLSQIEVLSLIDIPGYENLVPHNCMIMKNTLYVSYYKAGLQIFDISDPTVPVRIGYYDTYDVVTTRDYMGAWGVYCFLPDDRILVSDMNSGLYLFEFSRPYASIPELSDEELGVVNSLINFSDDLIIRNAFKNDIFVRVYDLMGRPVYSEQIGRGESSINFFDFSSGKYIVQFYDENQCVKTCRVVKQ